MSGTADSIHEWLPLQELREYNEALFQKQMDYLWANSGFYQEKFSRAGVKREHLKTLVDLTKIPFTTKDELRESQSNMPPLGIHMAAPRDKVKRIYSTSGTTGTPCYVGLTVNDLQGWIEIAIRGLRSRGVTAGHTVVNTSAAGPFVAGIIGEAIHQMGACLIQLGPGHTNRVVEAFLKLNAEVIQSTPSYAFHLLDYCRNHGIEPSSLGIKRFLVAGEPGGGIPAIRNQIEQVFQAKVREGMGIADISPSLWSECELGMGMHLSGQGFVHVELIDPVSGENVPWEPGVEGETVYTHLLRECVPMVRFRSRERVEVTATECACGRTSPLIRCVGRTDDMLIIRGVNVYPSAVQDVVSSFYPRTSGEMEIQLIEPGPQVLPPLMIKVEYSKDENNPQELATTLEKVIREKLLFRAKLEMVPEGSLPRYQYKRQPIRHLYREGIS